MNQANMSLAPDMLAMIIGSTHNPDNIGKTVKLIRFVKKGEFCHDLKASAGKDLWVVEGRDLAHTLLCGWTGEFIQGSSHIGGAEPRFLMPIRPEEDPLEFEVEKENAALA